MRCVILILLFVYIPLYVMCSIILDLILKNEVPVLPYIYNKDNPRDNPSHYPQGSPFNFSPNDTDGLEHVAYVYSQGIFR